MVIVLLAILATGVVIGIVALVALVVFADNETAEERWHRVERELKKRGSR